MKIKKISILFFALAISLGFAQAQTVDELVAKHTEAMGGKANLDKLKTLYLECEIDFGGMKIPIKMWRIDKKAMKVDIEVQGMTGNQVVTDKDGWAFMPFQGQTKPEPSTAEDVKSAKSSLDIAGDLVDYAAKGNVVTFLGKDEFEGTDVYKLQVVDKEGNITTEYLDANSYLLIKTESKRKIQDKEIDSKTVYGDFRKLDCGVTMPHSIESGMGGALIVKKYEINPVIDPKIFDMPAK